MAQTGGWELGVVAGWCSSDAFRVRREILCVCLCGVEHVDQLSLHV